MIQIYSKHENYFMNPLFESANNFYVKREYLYYTSGLNKYFGKVHVFFGGIFKNKIKRH